MQIEFSGKVGLITGASSGIGRATARHFARSGARLMLTGRDLESLEVLRNELGEDGLNCQIESGDITNPEFRSKLIHKINGFGFFGRSLLLNGVVFFIPLSLASIFWSMSSQRFRKGLVANGGKWRLFVQAKRLFLSQRRAAGSGFDQGSSARQRDPAGGWPGTSQPVVRQRPTLMRSYP